MYLQKYTCKEWADIARYAIRRGTVVVKMRFLRILERELHESKARGFKKLYEVEAVMRSRGTADSKHQSTTGRQQHSVSIGTSWMYRSTSAIRCLSTSES